MKTSIRIINPIAKAMNEGRRREYAHKVIPDKTKYNRKKGNKYGKSNSLDDIERSSWA